MFTINELSKEEDNLVNTAKELFGSYFENANQTIRFSWNFLYSPRPDAWIHHAFFTQYNKSIILALMSALRQHTVQTEMNMRNALESCVLACYALYLPKENEFVYRKQDGTLGIKNERKDTKKRYEWLSEKYPYHNNKIKYFKDRINDNFAHSNFVTALMNVKHDFEEGKFVGYFFDNNEPWNIKTQLWMVCNMTLGIMELLNQVAKDYPLVKVKPEFKDRMHYFWTINNRQKETIKNDPDFPERVRKGIILE